MYSMYSIYTGTAPEGSTLYTMCFFKKLNVQFAYTHQMYTPINMIKVLDATDTHCTTTVYMYFG